MAGKTNVTKGYSAYTDIPARLGGYNHGPKNSVNPYAVETKTIERDRAPVAGYTDFVGSPSKIELLKEYVHSPDMLSGTKGYDPNHGINYENSSPPKFHNEGTRPMKPNNFSNLNRYHPSSRVHGYRQEEPHVVHSRPGFPGARQVRTGNTSGPNKSWQGAGSPTTYHPLTTSTSNINEALGFLESANHSPHSDPRRGGVLDELSTRPQPQEPQKRYPRPAFVAKANDIYRKRF